MKETPKVDAGAIYNTKESKHKIRQKIIQFEKQKIKPKISLGA